MKHIRMDITAPKPLGQGLGVVRLLVWPHTIRLNLSLQTCSAHHVINSEFPLVFANIWLEIEFSEHFEVKA